jgi:hypothetical protein
MDAWDLFVQGKIFDAILYNYINVLGGNPVGEPLFFTIILGSLIALIYIKTKSIELCSVIIMLSGAALIPIVSPQSRVYFLVIAILGATIGIYNVIWKRRFGE